MSLFYLIPIPVSLYFVYLFSFKYYQKCYYEDDSGWRRVKCQPIIYISLLIVSFVPLVNIAFPLIFGVIVIIEPNENKIDTWLFRTPEGT